MNGCTAKLPAGANKNVWSSLAFRKAVMATTLSPPGRFSTTTGCAHSACNLSAKTRAPMSAPAPGPKGTINFTGLLGHVAARPAVKCPLDGHRIFPQDSLEQQQSAEVKVLLCPRNGHAKKEMPCRVVCL